jgi:hypothetical protein
MINARYLFCLTIALAIAWGMLPAKAQAQACCPPGTGGGHAACIHGGQPSLPSPGILGGQAVASPHSSAGGCPMGSAYSGPEPPKAATDGIPWPKLLQLPAFASERRQIEAPYRRSETELSTPSAIDYRRMAKTIQDMRAILEWLATHGVDTHDYGGAKDFLNRIGAEASKRSQLASSSAIPSTNQAVASPKAASCERETDDPR